MATRSILAGCGASNIKLQLRLHEGLIKAQSFDNQGTTKVT